jgi:glutaredoxin-like YruB-family protein
MRFLTGLLATLLLAPAMALADVYKWTDASGQVHYGDAPAPSAKARKVEVEVNTYKGVKYTFPPPKPVAARRKDVVMYTTQSCGYCKQARRYFEAKDIPYTEYDIEKDETARLEHERLGGRGVPLIQVGEQLVHGFDTARFEKFYGK